MTYTFNTDIMLSEADRHEAGREFPKIAFGLYHPELVETFSPIDDRANKAKARSRRWGVFAVLLATFALILAGLEILYHGLPKDQVRLIAAAGGVAGIVSVVIGVFGVMFRKRKMRWLADRMATERMRQFQFQYMVFHAADLLAAAKSDAARQAYFDKRQQAFEAFRRDVVANVDHDLHHLVETEDPGEELIFQSLPEDVDPNDPHLEEFFRAYDRLRFQRQIGYCDYILRNRQGFWKNAPVRQAKILEGVAMACVFAILLLHALVFAGALANIAWMKGPLVHAFAICAAVIALSARTFEEGFQPEREIERMRQYRLSLRRIYNRFQTSTLPVDKLLAMRDLERLSYEEMVLFLKGNYEAQFVM